MRLTHNTRPLPAHQLLRLAHTTTERRFMFRVNRETHKGNRMYTNRPTCQPARKQSGFFARVARSIFWVSVVILAVGTLANVSSAPPAPFPTVRVFEDCSFAPSPGSQLPALLVAINTLDDDARAPLCAAIFPDWFERFD